MLVNRTGRPLLWKSRCYPTTNLTVKSLDFERASKSNSFHLRPARIVSSFFFRFEPATENSTKGRHSSFMVREDLHRQKIDKCEFLVYVVDKKKRKKNKDKRKYV